MNAELQPASLCVHGLRHPQPGQAVAPGIELTTTFAREEGGGLPPHIYSRSSNPSRQGLEAQLAALDKGRHALCFSSGLAAVHALFSAILQPGDHVVIPQDVYHGTKAILRDLLAHWNISYTAVDMRDLLALEVAFKPNTKLIWTESPSNPLLTLTNLKVVAQMGKAHGITTVCDSTFASPILQQPLAMGINVVMHSSTKFMGGHSDLIGGVLVVNDDAIADKLRLQQSLAGAVPSGFDVWLLQRSLATLALRVQQQSSNALALAEWLSEQAQVTVVHYPGLPSHPQYKLAQSQLQQGFGGVLSFELTGGEAAALRFASALKMIVHATSLGGVESLMEHRRSVEGHHPVSPEGLLRFSVGIEDLEDLKKDLQLGFAAL